MSAFEDIMTGLFEALEDSKNLCKTLPRHTISSESMADFEPIELPKKNPNSKSAFATL